MKRQCGLLLIDLLLIEVATTFALLLRNNFDVSPDQIESALPYFGLTLLVALPVIGIVGLNRAIWRLSTLSDYLKVVQAVAIVVPTAVVLGFLLHRMDGVARSLPVLQGLLMIALMGGARVASRLHHRLRQQQRRSDPAARVQNPSHPAKETVLVVGMNRIAELYLAAVEELADQSVTIAGILGRGPQHTGRLVRQHKVLGTLKDVTNVVRDLEVHGVSVDRIVVTAPFAQLSNSGRAALLNIERATAIKLDFIAERLVAADASDPTDEPHNHHVAQRNSDGHHTASFKLLNTPFYRPVRHYWSIKRWFDLVASAALIGVMLPVIAVVVVMVLIDVGFPLTFWQQRPGLGGRPFRLYKFRTMAAAFDARGLRLSDDVRVSAIGRFLRRTRLDELPQLYNILIGDMSFIGPRPLLPKDQSVEAGARLRVRPGLTGWAQVNGGKSLLLDDKMALDLWYIRHASFVLDVRIVLETVRMVVFGEVVRRGAVDQARSEVRFALASSPSHWPEGNCGTIVALSEQRAAS